MRITSLGWFSYKNPIPVNTNNAPSTHVLYDKTVQIRSKSDQYSADLIQNSKYTVRPILRQAIFANNIVIVAQFHREILII